MVKNYNDLSTQLSVIGNNKNGNLKARQLSSYPTSFSFFSYFHNQGFIYTAIFLQLYSQNEQSTQGWSKLMKDETPSKENNSYNLQLLYSADIII